MTIFVVQRHDGLGGRVTHLLNGLSFAKRHGLKCVVIWPKLRFFRPDLDDLLDPDFYNYCVSDMLVDDYGYLYTPRQLRTFLGKSEHGCHVRTAKRPDVCAPVSNEDLLRALEGRVYGSNAPDVTHLRKHKDPKLYAIDDVRGYDVFVYGIFTSIDMADVPVDRSLIVPSPEVARRVDEFAEANDLGSVIGVHVRAGDRRTVPDLRHYFRRLKGRGERCLLCTENDDIKNRFRAALGDRVLTFPVSGYGYRETAHVVDAFAELLLLARCKALCYHDRKRVSAFPRASIALGGFGPAGLIPVDAPMVPNRHVKIGRFPLV